MKKTHTPGPWEVRKYWSDEGAYEIYPTRGKKPSFGQWASIAEVTGDVSKSESAMKNARLIAAAPELLEALQWLVDLMPDPELDSDPVQREQVIKAKVVIAKATGQTL